MLTSQELEDPGALESLIQRLGKKAAFHIIAASQLFRVTGQKYGGRPKSTFYYHERRVKAWREDVTKRSGLSRS